MRARVKKYYTTGLRTLLFLFTRASGITVASCETCESYRELKKNGAKSEAGSHVVKNVRADLLSIFVAIAFRGNASTSFHKALGNDGFPREMHIREAIIVP